MIVAYGEHEPQLGEGAWVASSAMMLGDVRLGAGSSVWYGSVVRGDVNSIRIGVGTNIQDRCVVHVSTRTHPTQIGDHVTIGHGAVIHGCTIDDVALIGIGAVVLDGAVVERECVVAAGSLLPPGKRYPSGSLVVGSPAIVKRQLDPQERARILTSAEQYIALSLKHAEIELISK